MAAVENIIANGKPDTSQVIDVKNPVTGAVVGQMPVMSADEVHAAAVIARQAQRFWANLPVDKRAMILERWGDLMWSNQQEIIQIIRDETGKTETGAFAEVVLNDSYTTYYTGNGPRFLASKSRPVMIPLVQRGRVHYQPHGLVGVISPWNYPLMLAMWDVMAALLAGNAVLVKPSEITPFTVIRAVELMHEAGVPKSVVQVMTGAGETGAAVVDTVDYISFTGSAATGRIIARTAGERLIPYSLELGGKDPMIVLADANQNLAAHEAITGAFQNAGQACTSVERLYVVDEIYDEFVALMAELGPKIIVSAEPGLQVHMGSMTNQAEFDRTGAHIQDALDKGARVIYGGNPLPELGPLFHEPTILADCTHDMDIMRDETFGPVLPLMRVENAMEAVHLANDSEYGLTASIFTKDIPRAEVLARQINVGLVSINRMFAFYPSPALPWGGTGISGVGRRGGPEGLLRFTKTQSTISDSQFGLLPWLNAADPLTINYAKIMRRVRRILPRI